MRQILSTMFLIIPFLVFSQSPEIKITGNKQSWAGGVCCSSGTNYSLVLSSSEIDLSELKLERITIDGKCISKGWQITNSNLHLATITFGISQNRSSNWNIVGEEKEHKDHECAPENTIRLRIKGKTQDFPISELEELPYLAYP